MVSTVEEINEDLEKNLAIVAKWNRTGSLDEDTAWFLIDSCEEIADTQYESM